MRYIRIVLPTICFFFCVSSAAAQSKQGMISGTIKDAQTKSPLTEAVITISSTAFAGQKFVLTDSAGTFKVTNLPAGNYIVSFEMEGYEKLSRDSIVLNDGVNITINLDMARGRKKSRKNQLQVAGYKLTRQD